VPSLEADGAQVLQPKAWIAIMIAAIIGR